MAVSGTFFSMNNRGNKRCLYAWWVGSLGGNVSEERPFHAKRKTFFLLYARCRHRWCVLNVLRRLVHRNLGRKLSLILELYSSRPQQKLEKDWKLKNPKLVTVAAVSVATKREGFASPVSGKGACLICF